MIKWVSNPFLISLKFIDRYILSERLPNTVPTTEIVSGKKARTWVSMVLYLKK